MTKKNETNQLTGDEKKKLKSAIHEAWPHFPLDLKKVIVEAKKHKLNIMYMIHNWAEENGNQIIVELLARKISESEAKLTQMEQELKE